MKVWVLTFRGIEIVPVVFKSQPSEDYLNFLISYLNNDFGPNLNVSKDNITLDEVDVIDLDVSGIFFLHD